MKRVAVVLLLLIANALMGSSKPSLPETAPGKLLRAWLEEIGESHAELRQAAGVFELYKVDRSTSEELAVVLKSDNDFLTRFMRLS